MTGGKGIPNKAPKNKEILKREVDLDRVPHNEPKKVKRKHAASTPATASGTRPGPNTSAPNAKMEVTVKLAPRYLNFPPTLRTKLERAYKNALTVSVQVTSSQEHVRYTVARGTFEQISPSTCFIESVKRYTSVHDANVETLEQFLVYNPAKMQLSLQISDLERDMLWEDFIENTAKNRVKNPEFMYMNPIRIGDIGWGFDIDGCLSLHMIVVEPKVKIKFIYVQRQPYKTEVE